MVAFPGRPRKRTKNYNALTLGMCRLRAKQAIFRELGEATHEVLKRTLPVWNLRKTACMESERDRGSLQKHLGCHKG